MSSQKYLWLVHFASITRVIQQAKAAGITTLVIRTDTSNNLRTAIELGHAAHLKVMGWRWPSTTPALAMNEAANAEALFAAGLDGYIADPEGDQNHAIDWNQPGLAPLAEQFCSRIKAAAGSRPFGVTSHYLAAKPFPHLPWSTFVSHADMLLPQAYWRSGNVVIGDGKPVDDYTRSLAAWGKLTPDTHKITPMAGELGSVTAAEITQYATHAASLGKDQHYYVYTETLSDDIWSAIKAG
jgi:hypothetical protein